MDMLHGRGSGVKQFIEMTDMEVDSKVDCTREMQKKILKSIYLELLLCKQRDKYV